jgi:hypothetical protein
MNSALSYKYEYEYDCTLSESPSEVTRVKTNEPHMAPTPTYVHVVNVSQGSLPPMAALRGRTMRL